MADRATVILTRPEPIGVELDFPHRVELRPDWDKDPPDWTTIYLAPNEPLAIANLEPTRPVQIMVANERDLAAPELARAVGIGLELYPDVAIFVVPSD
jgi:hypothetical protein